MKAWLIVAITWTILQSSTLIAKEIGFELDLANPTKARYSDILTSIRNFVKDSKLDYGGTGIPVMAAPENTYFRVNLTTPNGMVALALNQSDLYVVALMAKNDKDVNRTYYFDNDKMTSAQLDNLFPEAKGAKNQQKITEYKEGYASLKKAAGFDNRKKAGLGIGKLVTYLEGVNGKAREVLDEAKFMLVAIQMISEATRFRYIEQMVLNNFPNGFTPDDKVFILERNWKRISEEIKKSKNGEFKSLVVLKCDEVKTTWPVSKVKELNMGILKHIKNAELESFPEDYDVEYEEI